MEVATQSNNVTGKVSITQKMFQIGCCSICFDPLAAAAVTDDATDDVSAAACGHVFHTKCVAKWSAASNGDCPQCRQKITGGSLLRLFLVQDDNGEQNSSGDGDGGNNKITNHEADELQVVQVAARGDVILCYLIQYKILGPGTCLYNAWPQIDSN